jgi:hypothetical protein
MLFSAVAGREDVIAEVAAGHPPHRVHVVAAMTETTFSGIQNDLLFLRRRTNERPGGDGHPGGRLRRQDGRYGAGTRFRNRLPCCPLRAAQWPSPLAMAPPSLTRVHTFVI